MIKTKALSAFIICSLLISGISSSYDEVGSINSDSKESKSSSSLCTWRNAAKAFVSLLALGGAAFDGYEYGKNSVSPQTPAFEFRHPTIPLKPNKPSLVCPSLIPLNGKDNCSSIDKDIPYCPNWAVAHMGEAVHSEVCLPDCTSPPDIKQDSFKAPKTFVVDANSPHLKPFLDKMRKKNVPYYNSGFYVGFGEAGYYYTYESATGFEVPPIHFTVEEIENDPEAMKTITEWFNIFTEGLPCDEFRLVEE